MKYEDFEKSIKPLGDFNIGDEIVRIDTTDFKTIDFGCHIETAHNFIKF